LGSSRSGATVQGVAGMTKSNGEQTFIIQPDLVYGASRRPR